MKIEQAARCPKCGKSTEVVPIAYGMPAPELIDSAARHEVVIGGCVLNADDSYCRRCRLAFTK